MADGYRVTAQTPIIRPMSRTLPLKVFVEEAEIDEDDPMLDLADPKRLLRLQANLIPDAEWKDAEIQRYTVEGDLRPRYEKIVPGETVRDWMKRIVARTGEKWGWVKQGNIEALVGSPVRVVTMTEIWCDMEFVWRKHH
jgi:hypothetical protein